MAHIGMMPQSVRLEGGYRIKGKTPEQADALLADALAVEKPRAPLPCCSNSSSPTSRRRISAALKIPTIGIGSGASCDGQVLVSHDLIGLFPWFTPKFVTPRAQIAESIRAAATAFITATKAG